MSRGTCAIRVTILLAMAAVIAGCTSFPSSRDRNVANRETSVPVVDAKTSFDTQAATQADKVDGSVDPTSDVWARIRQGLQLHTVQDPRITKELRWFKDNPNFLTSSSRRAEPFLFHIVSEIERRGMPIELAFIPIVESAFQAKANSPSQASGIWQFIPDTGTRFGLKQDWWYDERRDFVKATDAALDYLAALHTRFDGDWLLAIAAYNNGEGNIERARLKNQRKHLPRDFWSLELRRETAEYVPKILAVAQVIAHPELYGQALQPILNKPYFAIVDTGRPIDLRQLESGAGLSADVFQAMNAGYRRQVAGPNGPYNIYVPIGTEGQVRQTVATLPRHARADWQHYQIRPGDTLSGIAARFGTTVSNLQASNQIKGTMLRAGQQLLIPPVGPESKGAGMADTVAIKTTSVQPKASGETHVVMSGETLSAIAKQYGISIAQLTRANNIEKTATLRVGQRLVTRPVGGGDAARPDAPRQVNYEVRKGDSLWRISSRFAVTVPDLQRWNSLSPAHRLQPGQKLTVFLPPEA